MSEKIHRISVLFQSIVYPHRHHDNGPWAKPITTIDKRPGSGLFVVTTIRAEAGIDLKYKYNAYK